MKQTGKILVVDDTEASRELLMEILNAQGHVTIPAEDGEQALHAALMDMPDLILLDIAMPGMDGFEVCLRLKAQPETRDIPVIFVSGAEPASEKVHGFEVGAVDFISKPFEQGELLARVNTHLELHRLRHRLESMVMDSTLQLRQSRDMLREVTTRRENAREEERRHVAREVHDDLGQMLGSLRLRLSTLIMLAPPGSAEYTGQLNELMGLTDQTIRVVRDVVSRLRTPVLDAGIVPGLEWLINDFQRTTGLLGRLTLSRHDIDLPEDISTALFRIAQESLTNVTRYARACRVDIELGQLGNECRLEVRDDGQGFDPHHVREKAYGLEGMRERCHMLGGELQVVSAPGQGTVIRASIPLRADKLSAPSGAK